MERNNQSLQAINSTTCGRYALRVLVERSQGRRLRQFVDQLRRYDYVYNDTVMARWMNNKMIHKSIKKLLSFVMFFRTPSAIQLAGPSGSGKTVFVRKLLKKPRRYFRNWPNNLHYCYGVDQAAFDPLKDQGVHFLFIKAYRPWKTFKNGLNLRVEDCWCWTISWTKPVATRASWTCLPKTRTTATSPSSTCCKASSRLACLPKPSRATLTISWPSRTLAIS